MGSGEEYVDMIKFSERNKISPAIDTMYPLTQFERAFQKMEKAQQLGKIGFNIS